MDKEMSGERGYATRREDAAVRPLSQLSVGTASYTGDEDGEASVASIHVEDQAVSGKEKRGTPSGNGQSDKPATIAAAAGAGARRSDQAEEAKDDERENGGEDKQRQSSGTPVKKKRRRKREHSRPGEVSSSSSSVPEAPMEYLLQYTCRLLKSQALDYEVRGREMEEKNSAQALEIEAWERKVRALKRRLHDLQYDGAATTCVSLATANGSGESKRQSSGGGRDDAAPSVASIDATDSLIPVNVAQIEGKVQQLICERTQKLAEFAQSLPGDFKETLEQQISRLVDGNQGIRR